MRMEDPTEVQLALSHIKYNGFRGGFADHVSDVMDAIRDSVGRGRGLVALTPASLSATLIGAFLTGLVLARQRVAALPNDPFLIVEELVKGDIVSFRGLRGIFEGVGSFSGIPEPKIKLRYRDGVLYGIDLHHVWEITKCGEDVQRPDKYEARRDQPGPDALSLLARILGRPKRLPPRLGVQVVVVTTKQNAVRHFPALSYQGIACASILPTAYYRNLSSFERIGEDPLVREPVIRFFSNLDQAVQSVSESRDVAALLVHGIETLSGHVGRIEDLQSARIPVVIVGEAHKLDREDDLLLTRLYAKGFRVTVSPTRGSVSTVGRTPQAEGESRGILTEPIRVFNVATYTTEVSLVDNSVGQTIGHMRERLLVLRRQLPEIQELRVVLASLWAIVNALARLPLSNAYLRTLGVDYDEKLNWICSKLPVLYRMIPRERFDEIERFCRDLSECIAAHDQLHPKYDTFLARLKGLSDTGVVVVGTSSEREALAKWMTAQGIGASVLAAKDLNRVSEPFSDCITTGWFSSIEKLPLSGLVRRNVAIFYPYEKNVYEERERNLAAWLGRLSNGTLAMNEHSLFGESSRIEVSEFDMDRLMAEEADKSTPETDPYPLNDRGPERATGVEALLVAFEEGFVAFLTPNHRCWCLDLDDERIFVKRPRELRPGDVLVFVKDSSSDIFDELISMLWAEAQVRQTVQKSRLWKEALERYMRQGDYTIAEIQDQLKRVGVERSAAAIRRWLVEDAIGPGKDVIRAIARLTQDAELNRHLPEVIKSCRRLRALHAALGRYLVRSIVTSTIDATVFDDALLARVAQDLSRHAELVTVRRVKENLVTISPGRANRLQPVPKAREV